MKKKKKFLSLLLAVALVLTTGVLPVNTAFAAMVSGNVENEETEDVFTWTYDLSENKLVIGGKGEFENLYDVGEGDYSIKDFQESAKSIKFQSGITKIGEYTFSEWTSLKNISVPSTVTEIGKSAFDNCYDLEDVTLVNGLKKIGEGAFVSCYSLRSISIPSTVTEIGNAAFFLCESLESALLPEGIRKIGSKEYCIYGSSGAFARCESLKSIIIPRTVTEIEDETFAGCTSLESVTLNNGLKSIGYYAFGDCKSLREISIPSTVTEIGSYAFEGCITLEKLSLLNNTGMTEISRSVFDYCKGLKEITLPDSITQIRYGAFWGCSSLGSIKLPSSLKTIDMNAFASCSSLSDVQISQGANNSTLTTIEEFAFSDCKALGSLTLPKGLNTIGKATFKGCLNLKKLTIPENVSYIGPYAYGYSSLNYGSWTDEGFPIVGGTKMPDAAIYGVSGTQAEVYAKANNIPFYATDVREPQNLTFEQSTVSKAFGDAAFTKTVSNDKPDGGTVTYSSSNPEVASVEQRTGMVTINDVGTARITAVASEVVGKYTSGTASYTITVSPKTLTPTVIVAGPDIAPGAYVFSGIEKRPPVTVKDGETVISDDQYTVACSNNIDAGEATVKVSPVNGGRYTWSAPAEAHFTISKAKAPRLAYADATVKAGTVKEITVEVCGMPDNAKPDCFDIYGNTNADLVKINDFDTKTGRITLTTLGKANVGDEYRLPLIVIMGNYENAYPEVVVKFVDKDIPTISVDDISVTYNGRRIPDEAIKGTATCNGADVEGTWTFKDNQNLIDVADSGKKAVVFLPTDQRNFASVETVIDVEIKKAVFPINITFEKVTTSGKTLKDITPAVAIENGEFEWSDGDDTPIVANRKYGWTFIPYEYENYEIITGEVIPWVQSSAAGIGGGGGGLPVAPVEKPATDPTQSGNTTTTDMSGSIVSKGGQTTTTVDKQVADKLVETAVANKSEEIVISTVTKNQSAASSIKSSEVALPAETLQTIADKTNANIVIKTDVAEVKLDNKAAEAVASQAQAGTAGKNETVSIVAEKVKEEAKEVRFELKVVTSSGEVISDFNGGNVSVTVNVPKSLSNKNIVCVYIDENGYMHKMDGRLNSDGTYSFTTGHFSTYAIMSEEEVDAAIKEQKEAVKALKLKLRSELIKRTNGKKAIKLTWSNPSDIELDGVEIYRSVKKNSGYGKKPIYVSRSGMYINTAVKPGKKYYYKVRGFVTIDGEKVYTDYSYKAYRTVK